MSHRITLFAPSLAVAISAILGGCAPLVSELAPDTIAVQARDAGPDTMMVAEEACAAQGRKSFGPLSYRCVDAKNAAYCQQKAYVFACNLVPDDTGPSTAVASAAPPSPQSAALSE